ncbi:MAG: cell wall hydrolase [Proteobacteria bacterium]|nr:cell wall hydrolase [Pseudomonadota bacterium]
MRIFAIIFAFALMIPLLLPQQEKARIVPAKPKPVAVVAAEPTRAPAEATVQLVSAPAFAQRADLETLIWALEVLGDEVETPEGRCLTQVIYFEARSEPVEGQLAVAQVVLNRTKNQRFPDTICGVVFQNEKMKHRCQFSFACDGLSDNPYNPEAWDLAKRIGYIALSERWEDITYSATYYHANYVLPYWVTSLETTARHGRHIFYRDGAF